MAVPVKSVIKKAKRLAKKGQIPDRREVERLITLYNQSQLQQALSLSKKLAKSFPNALIVFNIMGAINAAIGDFESAVAAYTKARDIDPNIAEIHNNLGLALNALAFHEKAIDSYQKAINLKPDFAGAYNNMGLAVCDLGKPKEAIDCYLKALKIDSNFAEVYNNIGLAQNLLQLHDKALISFDKAIGICADNADMHMNKGIALILMGKNEEAMDSLVQALHLNSDIPNAELLFHFSTLPADLSNLANIDFLSMLETFHKDRKKSTDPLEVASLNLVKAAFLHNAGRFEEAWNILVTENQIVKDQLGNDFLNEMKINQNYLQVLGDQAQNIRINDAIDENLPISLFILGPSQSGKSTLEKLIASSPTTKQGYESLVLANSINFAAKEVGITEINYLEELPTEFGETLKRHYMDLVKNFADPGQIFTITEPGIIRSINHAAQNLPNVRMLFVKRNIDDNALRIFFKQYSRENTYAYDIDYIKIYITWYNEMIDLLHSRFPQISGVIQYEDMISNPEETLQAVSTLCGLDLLGGEISITSDDCGCAKPYLEWMPRSQQDA